MVSRLVMSGLRCSNEHDVNKKRLGALFSDDFIQELRELREGLSLESSINELLVMAGCVAGGSGKVCPSVYGGVTTVVKDTNEYGVDVLVDMSGAKTLATVLGSQSLSKRASVRDALFCYAGAFVKGGAFGAKLETKDDAVGVVLVESGEISVVDTMRELMGYMQTVKSEAGERARRSCVCAVKYPKEDGNVVLRRLSSLSGRGIMASAREVRYEILPDGKIQRHDAVICELIGAGLGTMPYVVTLDGLKAAISPGYDRWIHEGKKLCCVSKCGCWKFGVREIRDVGWYVSRQFLCDGAKVCGTSELSRFALSAMGLRAVKSNNFGVWYQYSEVSAKRWIDSVGSKKPKRVLGHEIVDWHCALLRVRMLVEWYEYVDWHALGAVDVLRGVGFRSDGTKYQKKWTELDGMFIAGQYECACGDLH